jgi:hypothetical protein
MNNYLPIIFSSSASLSIEFQDFLNLIKMYVYRSIIISLESNCLYIFLYTIQSTKQQPTPPLMCLCLFWKNNFFWGLQTSIHHQHQVLRFFLLWDIYLMKMTMGVKCWWGSNRNNYNNKKRETIIERHQIIKQYLNFKKHLIGFSPAWLNVKFFQ